MLRFKVKAVRVKVSFYFILLLNLLSKTIAQIGSMVEFKFIGEAGGKNICNFPDPQLAALTLHP